MIIYYENMYAKCIIHREIKYSNDDRFEYIVETFQKYKNKNCFSIMKPREVFQL